jgi:hypothetical protein
MVRQTSYLAYGLDHHALHQAVRVGDGRRRVLGQCATHGLKARAGAAVNRRLDAAARRRDATLFKADFMAYASLYKQPVVPMGYWQVLIAPGASPRHGYPIEAGWHLPPLLHLNTRPKMAVETLYRSTRDLETTFVDRKLADAHDQMLELAEMLTQVLQKNVPGLSEKLAEDTGIYMAKNRGAFAAAFKSNANALNELIAADQPA